MSAKPAVFTVEDIDERLVSTLARLQVVRASIWYPYLELEGGAEICVGEAITEIENIREHLPAIAPKAAPRGKRR